MRIAFFTDVYHPTVNGVVASIDLFSDQLRKEGHEVTIICPTYKDTEDQLDIVRVAAVTFPSYKEYRIALPYSRKLDQHMKENNYDVVHIHSPFTIGLMGIGYARKFRMPIVYTAHTNYADYRHYVRGGKIVSADRINKVVSQFSNTIDATIAPSKKIASNLVEFGTKKPVAILPTGITKNLKGDRSSLRGKYKLDRKLVFMYLGRMTAEKNIDFLLRAFAQALRDLPPQSHLLLVGDGPYLKHLKALAKELSINQRVTFTGFLTGQRRADAYQAADIFCHTSCSETQGLTLLEAAQYGLPLVVSNDSAYEGIAVFQKNALLANTDSPGEYAKCLIKIGTNSAMRTQFGVESKRIVKNFDIKTQTAKLIDIYEDTIIEKRAEIVYSSEKVKS